MKHLLSRALLTYALLTSALLATGAAQADPPALTKIRFGDLGASTGNLYQRLALEKGIYRQFGLDLEPIDFLQGGPEETAAAASNQIDMGSAGTPVLTAISRGMPLRVVGAPPRKGQPFILVARPEIHAATELKGTLVGVGSVGGGASEALRVILAAQGIQTGDVQTIAFGTGPNGYLALKSGRLTAAVMAEPYATKAEVDGVGHILAEADQYFAHYEHSYVFATQKFIAEHPEAIRAYFQANRAAIAYARAHRDEVLALGRSSLKLEDKVLIPVLDKEMAKWDDSGEVDREGMLNAIQIVQSVGDISKTYAPDVDRIVDARFLH